MSAASPKSTGRSPIIWCPRTTPAALARAIVAALDDPQGAAELARRLRERVAAGFTIDSMVDGVLAAYDEALQVLQKFGRR